MKYHTKIALLTFCCCVMSGCMITRNVMTIGERYEMGSVKDAYLLDKNHVLLRHHIKICKNVAPLGSFNHVCEDPFYRDTVWKLVDEPKEHDKPFKEHTSDCDFSTKYMGNAVEVSSTENNLVNTDNLVKFYLIDYGSLGKRNLLLCSGSEYLFAADHSQAISYIKDSNIYIHYNFNYQKEHFVNYLIIFRVILLPFALVADTLTSPVQFVLMFEGSFMN